MVPLYLGVSLYRLFTAPSSRGTMVSMFTLLSSLLLVSAVLAIPSSLAVASFARGHEDPQSPPINRVASRADALSDDDMYTRDLAGALVGNGDVVCMIPMVHDHVQSHFFANRQVLFTSGVPSLSHTLTGTVGGISAFMFPSTVSLRAKFPSNLVSSPIVLAA